MNPFSINPLQAGAAMLATLLFGLAIGFGSGHKSAWNSQEVVIQKMKTQDASDRAAAERKTRELEQANARLTDRIEVAAVAKAAKTRNIYRDIERKVPIYVTPEIDRSYPLPCGLVRVLDAAAAGVPPERVSCAPGVSDDAPSDVTASEAGAAIAGNYEAFQVVVNALVTLQTWAVDLARQANTVSVVSPTTSQGTPNESH